MLLGNLVDCGSVHLLFCIHGTYRNFPCISFTFETPVEFTWFMYEKH